VTSNLAKIADHGRRADGIVRSMLAHAGSGGDRQAGDLNALNLAYHEARLKTRRRDVKCRYYGRPSETGLAGEHHQSSCGSGIFSACAESA